MQGWGETTAGAEIEGDRITVDGRIMVRCVLSRRARRTLEWACFDRLSEPSAHHLLVRIRELIHEVGAEVLGRRGASEHETDSAMRSIHEVAREERFLR